MNGEEVSRGVSFKRRTANRKSRSKRRGSDSQEDVGGLSEKSPAARQLTERSGEEDELESGRNIGNSGHIGGSKPVENDERLGPRFRRNSRRRSRDWKSREAESESSGEENVEMVDEEGASERPRLSSSSDVFEEATISAQNRRSLKKDMKSWMDAVGERPESENHDNAFPEPLAVPESVRLDVRSESRIERVLAARRATTNDFDADDDADVKFGSLADAKKAIETLGPVVEEPDPSDWIGMGSNVILSRTGTEYGSDASEESEWERAQLQRAGQGSTDVLRAQRGAAETRAKDIIEEERQLRGGRGEIGMSVAETCSDNITARVSASEQRVSKLTGELEAVDRARKRGRTEFATVEGEEQRAKVRRDYYAYFLQYLRDVSEMLSETSDLSVDNVNIEMERLRKLAAARASVVDEFGRAKRAALDVHGDGYESPPCEEHSLERPTAADPSNVSKTTSEVEQREWGDVLADVDDDFKSIPAIVARFTEWRTQFPADYEAAYGDLSLGKLCGAVALAAGTSSGVDWLALLPKKSVAPAIIKSRSGQWAVLLVAGKWEPLSMKSSAFHANAMNALFEGLVDHPREMNALCESFMCAILDVLKWRLGSMKNLLVAGRKADPLTASRAGCKCIEGALVVTASLQKFLTPLPHLVSLVWDEFLGGVVCAELQPVVLFDGSSASMKDSACSTLLLAVKKFASWYDQGSMPPLGEPTASTVRMLLHHMDNDPTLSGHHAGIRFCLEQIDW